MDVYENDNILVNVFVSVVITAIVFLLIFSLVFGANEGKKLDKIDNDILKNDKIILNVLNDVIEEGNVIYLKNDKGFEIYLKLEEMESGDSLWITVLSSYYDFTVDVGNERLFERSFEEGNIIKSGATSFDGLRMKDRHMGKTAHLSFIPNTTKKINTLRPEIYLGSESDIIMHILKKDIYDLIFSALVFLLGFVMTLIGIVYFFLNFEKNDFFSIGVFAILLSIYVFMQTGIVYIILSNKFIIYFLEYISASSLCIPIMFIMTKKMSGFWQKVYKFIFYFMGINISLQAILTISGVSEFIKFREFTMFMIFVQLAVIFTSLFFDQNVSIKNIKNKEDKMFYISILILASTFSGSIVVYMLFPDFNFMLLIFIGLIIFLSIQFTMALKRYVDDYSNFMKTMLLKERSMLDNLTNLGSRYAFDTRMNSVIKSRRYKNMLFCIMDINSLKYINDYYGHHRGDKVIMAMSEVLDNIRTKNKKTETYRIGGDEFALVSYNIDSETAEKIIESLRTEGEYYSNTKEDCLSFALGYELVDLDNKFDLKTLMRRVDDKMYYEKNLRKA